MATTLTETFTQPGSAGAVLAVLRDGRARTRSELATLTGLSRATVRQRIDTLLARQLVTPAGDAASTGGRPPSQFAFNPSAGLVLGADIGATHALLAVTDLAGQVLAEEQRTHDIADGPEAVLSWVVDSGRRLADSVSAEANLLGVGMGLPGPIEHSTGRPISPPIMPGWDGYDVIGHLTDGLAPVAVVDNDVNVMALGEHFTAWSDVDHLVYVKVGTGIGSGIISDGELRRGAQGAAGDLGHVAVPHAVDALCRCGNTGCLEAVAGGGAVVARLRDKGIDAHTSTDLVALSKGGSVEVVHVLREAGRDIGEVLATVVSMLNPSVIVLGGALAAAGEHLLAGVREVVYRRSLPLATQHLRIVPSAAGRHAGVIGAAVMVIERVLAPDAVDRPLVLD
ncbi:ROK family transcriptional regulator [Aquipuribacter sp. SD81]|uniref:ROK family transcriptional regulator n=1 Tax=Aquipuribacter sp. SD81 TaxID=3127703 RepID=UPI003018C82D